MAADLHEKIKFSSLHEPKSGFYDRNDVYGAPVVRCLIKTVGHFS